MYRHKPESVLENEMHEILWNFEIKMDPSIQARKPEQELINKNKNTCHQVDFAVPADHRVKVKLAKSWTNTWTLPEN